MPKAKRRITRVEEETRVSGTRIERAKEQGLQALWRFAVQENANEGYELSRGATR